MSDESVTLKNETTSSYSGISRIFGGDKMPRSAGLGSSLNAVQAVAPFNAGMARNRANELVQDDAREVVRRGLVGIHIAARDGVDIVRATMRTTSPYPPIYKGKLSKSGRSKAMKTGAAIDFSTGHAQIIEDGTKPFRPPYDPIARWVATKMNLPLSYVKDARMIRTGVGTGGGSRKKSQTRMSRRASGRNRMNQVYRFKKIVEAVRNKIAARGILPRHYAERSLMKLADECLRHVKNAIG